MYKLIIFSFLPYIILISSCKKEEAKGIDKELFDLAKDNAGHVWYKNSDVLLPQSSGTGHSQDYLRTRYNSIAATKLGADFKIQNGANFPEGSLIVKELWSDLTTFYRYAVLYKKPSYPDADAKGWVWGYINADGTVAKAASDKGDGCISCHSQSDNIDYMLMNKYFQ